MSMIIKFPINILYSLLMVLYFLGNTHFTEELSFRWGRLYLLVAIVIIIISIIKKISLETLKALVKDHYVLLATLIFIWGILVSFFSVQTILSIKKTISVLVVFIIFYLIPRYFHTHHEKDSFIIFLLLPFNALMTLLSTINLLHFFRIMDLVEKLPFWSTSASIYENPNTLGLNIMLTLMLTNVCLVAHERFKDLSKKNKILKIYLAFSYLVLIINLMFSSSRASLLGTVIAFIPLTFIFKKEITIALIPLGWFLWEKKENLYILKKLPKGTSGRGRIWNYAIKEVISKHPFLGVGSGAFQDYMGNEFKVNNTHNSYLEEIMSNGLVGFTLWLGVLALIFNNIFKLEKNKFIFIFTIFGFTVYSFFEVALFTEMSAKMSIFWAFVMLIENQ